MRTLLEPNNLIFLNKIMQSDLFKGGKNFTSDLTGAAVVAGGLLSVLCIIFQLLVSQIDALEEWGKHSKKVRKVAIIGVIIFMVSGLYKLVVEDYFGFKIDSGTKTTLLNSLRFFV